MIQRLLNADLPIYIHRCKSLHVNRPYLYFQYWTGTGFQWGLMQSINQWVGRSVGQSVSWLIDWIDWLTDRLTDGSIDQMIDWLIDWLIHWLINWLTDWLIDWLIDWLTELNWIDWLTDRLAGWHTDWLTDRSIDRSISQLIELVFCLLLLDLWGWFFTIQILLKQQCATCCSQQITTRRTQLHCYFKMSLFLIGILETKLLFFRRLSWM